MTVKFNQYWTVDHDKTSDYSKFVVKNYIPGMNKLGIHIVAGWTVLIGGYSEIFLEGISNNLELLECALRNENYKKLKHDLKQYILNYKTKVLVSTGRHDCYSENIKTNTTKIVQAWDIKSDRVFEYDKYVIEVFYPMLNDMSVSVANEWEVLIGDGPNIICEARAEEIDRLLIDLKSEKFQRTRAILKRYVNNYESRILTAHVCKDLGYKTAYYSVISV